MIRVERAGDADPIGALISEAFADRSYASGTEAQIVNALREAGALSLSLVAERAGQLIGQAVFSPAKIGEREVIALGPVAVIPELQGQGVGSALIREGLARIGPGKPIALLGDPNYYGRFGFKPAPLVTYEGKSGPFIQVLWDGPEMSNEIEFHPAFKTN